MASVEKMVQLDPSQVIPGENTRYSLKASRIDELAASIMEHGGVLVPVEVRELEDGTHELTSGAYRHAAVLKLNGDGAGLTLPAIVRNVDDKTRLLHQLSENMQRENQTPMDMAVAIRKLLDAGVERKEIRRLFARPTGKKGNESAPASNAWINIISGLLDLPKAIQSKIHAGTIGVQAAYLIGKAAPEKREAIVARIESEREAAIDLEEKDEQKFLAAESKVAEVEDKLTKTATEEAELKAGVEAAEKTAKDAMDAFRALQKADYLSMDEPAKQAHKKALTEAEGAVKAAQTVSKNAKNKLAGLKEKKHKLEEATEEAKTKLEEVRKVKAGSAKKKDAPISPTEVKQAAKAEGENAGPVPLNASEMRAVVKEIAKEPTSPRVAAIGTILDRIFSGELTTKTGIKEMAAVIANPPAAKAAPKKK